jgi:hypothetical protein
VDPELEALQTSAALIWDLVLGNDDGPSSLVASLSMVAELLKGWIDTADTNGVHWGTQSALFAALLHFPELKTELELHGSGWNADLTEDQMDALWPLVSTALDSRALLVPSLVARDPPDDAGE